MCTVKRFIASLYRFACFQGRLTTRAAVPPYLFSDFILANNAIEFLCQLGIFLAQRSVSLTLLLYLTLDICQRCLEMVSDFFPFFLIFSGSLNGLLLKGTFTSDIACRKVFRFNWMLLYITKYLHLVIKM